MGVRRPPESSGREPFCIVLCTRCPGFFLRGSRVPKSFVFKNAPKALEAAPFNSRHRLDFCSLQIKGAAVPVYEAQERGQPARGAHARPAAGGGGPREEGEAAVLTGRPGRRLSSQTRGRTRMCCEFLGASFFLLCFTQLYKLLFIEDIMYIYFR